MMRNTRRKFLTDVGSGMLAGALGSSLAFDLGITPVGAAEDSQRLTFGKMEPLVALMQDTPLEKTPARTDRSDSSGNGPANAGARGAIGQCADFWR